MHRALVLAILLLALSFVMAHADGGRVALVVGVSQYEHAGNLPNTLNDATDMSAALKRLGFDVDTMLDPSRSSLEAAVRRYGDRSTGAEVSVFYYSGHALEVGGHNWLLPATTNLKSQRDLRFEAVDLQTILEQTDGAVKVAIVFLDACRANPFAGRITASGRSLARGLARVEMTASGVLLAFSTAPGQIAVDGVSAQKNSPFTAALLRMSPPIGRRRGRRLQLTIPGDGCSRLPVRRVNSRPRSRCYPSAIMTLTAKAGMAHVSFMRSAIWWYCRNGS